MGEIKLDVCPRCRKHTGTFTQVSTGGGWGVSCFDCHLTLDTRAETKEGAATAWNTRTPLEVDEGAIDRAALALGRAQYQRGDAEAVFMSWFPKSIEMEQCRKDARAALSAAFGGKTDA